VNVHVVQARNQRPARAVDPRGSQRDCDLFGRADCDDAIPLGYDSAIRCHAPGLDIGDGYPGDRKGSGMATHHVNTRS
jgi:hypothetical protein